MWPGSTRRAFFSNSGYANGVQSTLNLAYLLSDGCKRRLRQLAVTADALGVRRYRRNIGKIVLREDNDRTIET